MTQYVLAVDVGSQSTKVAIYKDTGEEVAFASSPLREPISTQPGEVMHPDDDLWVSMTKAIESCLENFERPREEIAAIGLCTIRCCRVLLNDRGMLASPVISWMDERMNAPYKQNDDSISYVTTTSGYLAYRLTGERFDTFGNNELHWPIDRKTWDWSEDDNEFERSGLKREQVFHLVKPGESLGNLKKELAQQFGLNSSVAVVATSNDKAVEALGSGLHKNQQAMISLGTYISAMVVRDQDYINAKGFFSTLSSIPYRYVYESEGIRRGMWTVSWLKKLLGDELVFKAKQTHQSTEDYLNEQAEKVPAGSEGLITILDWLTSANTPYRRGMFIGFDHRHTSSHMYRSILEAIAFAIQTNLTTMLQEIEATVDELIVTGGGSKSDVLMQILADVSGVTVHRRKGTSEACLGAAIAAFVYLGNFASFEEGIHEMVSTDQTFHPDEEHHRFYTELNETVIQQVRLSTDEILKKSHALFSKQT